MSDPVNYTVTADRPDLAAIEVNPPEGYIADRIMPTLIVRQPSGKLYYHSKQARIQAQKNREDGVTPNKTQIAQTDLDFTCVQVDARAGIAPRQVPIMGGIEHADEIGAQGAKEAVMAEREKSVAALLLGGTATTFDPGNVTVQSAEARAATKGHAGSLKLVASSETLSDIFMEMVKDSATCKLMSNVVAGTSPNVAMTALDPEAQARAVAVMFGCRDVLAGDDEIWNDGDLAGRFAIVRLMDDIGNRYLFRPVYGLTLQYQPEDGQLVRITSTADTVSVNNLYTATTDMVSKILNSGAAHVFSLS